MKKRGVIIIFLLLLTIVFFAYADIDSLVGISPVNETITSTTNPEFYFNVSGNESIYACELFIQNSTGWFNYGVNLSVLNNTLSNITANDSLVEGKLYWYVNCTNATSSLLTGVYNLTIDWTVPSANLMLEQSVANDTWVSSGTPQIVFNVTDNLDNPINYTVYVDGTAFNASEAVNNTPVTVNLVLTNGSHAVYVEGFDGLLYANSSVLTVKVDTVAPMPFFESALNNTWTTDVTPSILFNITDATQNLLLNYSIYLDNVLVNTSQVTNATSTTVILSIVAEGNHTITLEGLDEAGNTQNKSIVLLVDATLPVVNWVSYPTNDTWSTDTTPSLTFNLTDNLDTVLNYNVYVDGAVTNASTVANNTNAIIILDALADGSHNILVEGYDEAGSRFNTSGLVIKVDTVAPLVTLTMDDNNTWVNNATYSINFFATDIENSVNYTVFINEVAFNTSTVNNNTVETVYLSITDGYYNFTVEAVDIAGNRQNSSILRVSYDITAPTGGMDAPINWTVIGDEVLRPSLNGQWQFCLGPTDNMDTEVAYQFYLNGLLNKTGSASSGYSTCFSSGYEFAHGSTINYSVTYTDNASNTYSKGVYYATINDTTAPFTAPVMIQGNVTDIDSDGNSEIFWEVDSNAAYYKLYRYTNNITNVTNLTVLAFVTSAVRTFEDNTTTNGTTYWYALTSVDSQLNENKSQVSDSFSILVNDTISPRLTTELNASTNSVGSVNLSWLAVTYDVGGNVDTEVTYRVFRTTNTSSLNTTNSSENIANTSSLTYTDTTLTTGINYSYVVTTVDDALNHNGSLAAGNQKAIIPSACTSNYTYTAWTTCSSSSQSRTGTRTCYGGGSTSTTESQSCTSSSSSSSRSSSRWDDETENIPTTKTTQTMNFGQIKKGDMIRFRPNSENIPVDEINFESESDIFVMTMSASSYESKPDGVDSVKNSYRYLEFTSSGFLSTDVKDSKIEITFKVDKTWVDQNAKNKNAVFMYRYYEGKWTKLQTEYVKTDGDYYIFKAFTPGFSYFSIAVDEEAIEAPEVVVEDVVEETNDSEPEVIIVPEETQEPIVKKGIINSNWAMLIVTLALLGASMLLYHHPKRKKQQKELTLDEIKAKLKKK